MSACQRKERGWYQILRMETEGGPPEDSNAVGDGERKVATATAWIAQAAATAGSVGRGKKIRFSRAVR